MNFINPVKGSTIKKDGFSKKVKIISFVPNDYVLAPYDGEITEISDSCGGKIKIKHEIDGGNLYSNFCKVKPTSSLFTGVKVGQGQKIATMDGDAITYSIEDGSGEKQDFDDFLIGANSKEKNKKTDSKTNSKSTKSYETPKTSSYKEPIGGSVLRGLLKPFDVISKSLDFSKEKELKNDENLKEEITRIKQLLK